MSAALAMSTVLGVLKIASSFASGSSFGFQLAFKASQLALPPIQVMGAACPGRTDVQHAAIDDRTLNRILVRA